MQLREVAVPEVGAFDVLVQVMAAGICHSDAHYRSGLSMVEPLPMTLGHEVAEIAAQFGLVLKPWQRYVVDVALEVNEEGVLAYDTVSLSVGRRAGKTLLVFLMALRRMSVLRVAHFHGFTTPSWIDRDSSWIERLLTPSCRPAAT